MTPEAQRIAIAKACGWKDCEERGFQFWDDPMGRPKMRRHIPDYLQDLNACAEMEKHAPDRCEYLYQLVQLEPSAEKCYSATAAQRCEAFLRSLGLWVDDEKEAQP